MSKLDRLSFLPFLLRLVFMDLRTPVMLDGITATWIIKHELNVKTPVVALTGEGGAEIQKSASKLLSIV